MRSALGPPSRACRWRTAATQVVNSCARSRVGSAACSRGCARVELSTEHAEQTATRRLRASRRTRDCSASRSSHALRLALAASSAAQEAPFDVPRVSGLRTGHSVDGRRRCPPSPSFVGVTVSPLRDPPLRPRRRIPEGILLFGAHFIGRGRARWRSRSVVVSVLHRDRSVALIAGTDIAITGARFPLAGVGPICFFAVFDPRLLGAIIERIKRAPFSH